MTNKFTQSLLILAAGGLMFVGSASAQAQNSKTLRAQARDRLIPDIPASTRSITARPISKSVSPMASKMGSSRQVRPRRLERGEKRLQKNEKRDMAKNNGHLTKQDQRQLNREANHMSARIAKDKHNANEH